MLCFCTHLLSARFLFCGCFALCVNADAMAMHLIQIWLGCNKFNYACFNVCRSYHVFLFFVSCYLILVFYCAVLEINKNYYKYYLYLRENWERRVFNLRFYKKGSQD